MTGAKLQGADSWSAVVHLIVRGKETQKVVFLNVLLHLNFTLLLRPTELHESV